MKPFDEFSPLNCRVVAASTREALRLVREKLGPDAIVLSNRVTPRGVEIVATLDEQQAMPVLQALSESVPVPVPVPRVLLSAQPTPEARPEVEVASLPTPAPVPVPVPVPEPEPLSITSYVTNAATAERGLSIPITSLASLSAVDEDENGRLDIHSMRGMIEEQLAGMAWNEQQRRDPVRGRLLRTLLGAGFSVQLARQLLKDLPLGQSYTSGMDYVRSELMRQMPVLENEDELMSQGGVYALTGPTGVGKTTTTAKLAARCVMRFGADKLALVTTDSYRIGAYEQLRIYGQILGVPVYAVKDPADLKRVLADLRDKHMVLIDTVGMSQRDRAVSDQIAMLCSTGRPVKRLLLLNASSHGDTLNEVVNAYRQSADKSLPSDLAGCIFTKVDEATHPGALIDMAIRHQLPVHYISSGQKVPEHLMLADRAALVDSVFQARSQSAFFVPIAATASDDNQADSHAEAAKAGVAQAQAVSQRLREQCQHLIRALTSNAQELSANAAALSGADIGFDESRLLWRKLDDSSFDAAAVSRSLASQARSVVSQNCRSYALAVSAPVSLAIAPTESASALFATLLLSDQTGQLLAVPGLSLADASNNLNLADLASQIAKPMVQLFARLPADNVLADMRAQQLDWLASCPASLAVMDAGTGKPVTLAKLAKRLCFVAPEPIMYRGKKAWLAVAETTVWLRAADLDDAALEPTTPVTLRCIVRRISDAQSGKPLTHSYMLANAHLNAPAGEIAQWPLWRAAADPYFKLLRQSAAQIDVEQADQSRDANSAVRSDGEKTLMIAAQSASTVYRLQGESAPWAEPARKSLAQLAGRSTRPDRPVPSACLLEGLEKLFVLLDALETDSLPSADSDLRMTEPGLRNLL